MDEALDGGAGRNNLVWSGGGEDLGGEVLGLRE